MLWQVTRDTQPGNLHSVDHLYRKFFFLPWRDCIFFVALLLTPARKVHLAIYAVLQSLRLRVCRLILQFLFLAPKSFFDKTVVLRKLKHLQSAGSKMQNSTLYKISHSRV